VIDIEEIRSVAAKVQLANTVVEKDYALGWLLWGINQHPIAGKEWVFKGGTCLKKCYFETYRFSEDLDFSFIGTEQPTVADLTKIMNDISDLVLNEAGLEFPKNSIQFEIFENPRGSLSIQGGIKYRGPVRPQVGLAHMQRIKIDLTLDEPLVLPAVSKQVEHPYSDKPQSNIEILAYDYEEVFAEKIRALAQRLRPRDLYDVVHLYRRNDLNQDRQKIYSTLEDKCRLRGISVPTHDLLETHENRKFLESEWENQLKHQIPILPDFESFLRELPNILSWLEGDEVESLDTISVSEEGAQEIDIIRQRISSLNLSSTATSIMDRIQFAAASRLVVRLGYDGSIRDVEPYSLARSSEGNLLLRAVRHQNGEPRSYRFDKITSLEVVEKTFVPRFAIEINSSGNLQIHQLSTKNKNSKTNSGLSNKKTAHVNTGPTYSYKCPVCGKIFSKKKMSPRIGEHKNRAGYACGGRTGIFLKTKY